MCTLVLEESPHTGRTHVGSIGESTAVQSTAGTLWLSEFLIRREHRLLPLEVPEQSIYSSQLGPESVPIWLLYHSVRRTRIWLLHHPFRGARMLMLSAKTGKMGRWNGHPSASLKFLVSVTCDPSEQTYWYDLMENHHDGERACTAPKPLPWDSAVSSCAQRRQWCPPPIAAVRAEGGAWKDLSPYPILTYIQVCMN